MNIHLIHSFPLSLNEMQQTQQKLQKHIHITPYHDEPNYVAGIDLAYKENHAIAVIVIMDYSSRHIIETVYQIDEVTQPYTPGYLAFRELPLILEAWKKVTHEPDIVFFDGNGILHPKRMGLATHASFFIEKPTIGIAKTPFIGTYDEPAKAQGSYSYIYDQEEIIGATLRTQQSVKPVFVSVGNHIDLASTIRLSMNLVGNESRIPEITRQADILTRKLRKKHL